MENPNQQSPATVNQISQEKPSIERSFATLQGNLGGSFNAGHHRTVAWFRLMPGQRIKEYKHNLKIKLLTPLSPAYQPLYCVADSFFVPDSRVYASSEEFVAQNGGTSKSKILRKPTLFGKKIPFIEAPNGTDYWSLTETSIWRDTFISSYIPRVGYHETYSATDLENFGNGLTMPEYDATLLRGKIAIWNDFRRNKMYEAPLTEYDGGTVSDAEWQSYIPLSTQNYIKNSMRARRNNSYFMDYRLDAQGFETDLRGPFTDEWNVSLVNWASIEAMVAEVRAQSENAEKNTWEVLHELYGTARKLSEGKTQHIGRFVFPLNYASVTQNAYSVGNNIEPQYQVMGQQGAYSYTEIEIPCFAGYEAIEGGWVHVELTVSAASVFERAFERTAMNVYWDDEFRPDLKNQKLDTLNYLEVENAIGSNGKIGGSNDAIGFKRKWSEYFKLPNVIYGDMTTADIEQTEFNDNDELVHSDASIITQATHQFYEENALGTSSLKDTATGTDIIMKKYYVDYTDLLVNKNQAILNEVSLVAGTGWEDFIIKGQNQIFYEGTHTLVTDLPIPEDIKSNFTKWGEH